MNLSFRLLCRGTAVAFAFAALVALVVAPVDAKAAEATASPEFTVAPWKVLVGGSAGYGGQYNQHLYANISGPPPGLPDLETKLVALQPQFVRVFFNTTEWSFRDRMASFVRSVQLARRTDAQINITWQGSTAAFAAANMDRFADVLADLLQTRGIESLWVTLFNEPNSTRITLAQYEQTYRLLDKDLRERNVRDRIRFMGGDLVGTTSPLGQEQEAWFKYLAANMGDLLDAWSIHVFWDFWDTPKVERRLSEVRRIFNGLPAPQRRPLYITEYGVRGLRSFDGESNTDPGQWLDGTPIAETTLAALQEAWFVVRAADLGYVAASKWDLYEATYDVGAQDYSAIGPGSAGWPLRPSFYLLRMLTLTTKATWSIVEVDRAPSADPAKLLAAYVSPAGNVTVVGLDTHAAELTGPIVPGVSYAIGGLPPNTRFRLFFWNGDGLGRTSDVGSIDTDASGTLSFTTPPFAVFALTSAPVDD